MQLQARKFINEPIKMMRNKCNVILKPFVWRFDVCVANMENQPE